MKMDPDKSITPTQLRNNVFQYLKQANHDQVIEIKGRRENQDAVILSQVQYQSLLKHQVQIKSTPQTILYQKLDLLNQIKDTKRFYQFGEDMIANILPPVKGDPMWNLTTKLLMTISCFYLRHKHLPLNETNIKEMADLKYEAFHNRVTFDLEIHNDLDRLYVAQMQVLLNAFSILVGIKMLQNDAMTIFAMSVEG